MRHTIVQFGNSTFLTFTLCAAALSIGACGSDDPGVGEGGSESSDASDASEGSEGVEGSADGECQVGTEDCPCTLGGLCDEGLVCEEEICVSATDGTCGDGVLDAGEECDQGDNNANDGICKEDCTLQVCGDGYVGPGEACDDGNDVDDDGCSNMCTLASCGDGVVQEGEECDDGNEVDEDECTNACTEPACGDGIVQEGEACDDGNSDEDDGCSFACEFLPFCGDGVVVAGEFCYDAEVVMATPSINAIDLGEFDGAPGPDLAVGQGVSKDVGFWINDGAGGFTHSANATDFSSIAVSVGDVIVGDYDGDGRDDIAIPQVNSGRMAILFGAQAPGEDMFRDEWLNSILPMTLGRGRSYPSAETPTRDDLYMIGGSQPGVTCQDMHVFSHDPDQPQGWAIVSGHLDSCAVASDLVIGNFDTDSTDGGEGYVLRTTEGWAHRFNVGDVELGVDNELASSVWLFGSLSLRPRLSTAFQADNSAADDLFMPEWNDAQCDYASDINACAGNVVKQFASQDGVDAELSFVQDIAVGRAPVAVTHGDLNSDGHIDLIVAYAIETRVDVFWGDGAGGFTLAEPAFSAADPISFDVLSADLNQDGIDDVILGNLYTQTVSVFLSNP